MFKILVVDDDPVIQLVLQKTLRQQGYEVIMSNSGQQGLELARQSSPALIICDWLMPGLDGIEVCRQIKAEPRLSSTFFILLTSLSDVDDRVMGLDAGADDILTKPVEVGELLARVRAGLRLYQAAQQLQALAQDLQNQKERLEAELFEAGDYIRSLLPAPLTGSIRSESLFIPCKQLGGDCFDYYWLDPDYLMVYLLDVSGHGLGAALLSVSIQNLIRSQSLPDINFYRPEDVLRGLNEIFQMSDQHPRYFSLWYGVYNRAQRRLTYASAGHPPAVLISGDHATGDLQVQQLKTRSAPIGMLSDSKYSSAFCQIEQPSRLLIFSDGGYELKQTNGEFWSLDQFIDLLTQHACANRGLAAILPEIQAITGSETFEDDFALLELIVS
ncbi:MAG: SpoIIE family protein phosphatase [Pegethrix bostrychoides GSE-TBD4-15B]|jgi:sigma-B regulation protein RsbU (phosphoserine phosphatase)|uniref:SpoIIE family protein phosphatase n=1 Tax=Pegethrix bostrychoides GSE-TBD4-15B TaxID=2839662 RepID=A0A951PAK4_9CYAN|nr:SpoIIE family protein phosphatase [Pegethrix bostrychoides GSE-TBD4-15B]